MTDPVSQFIVAACVPRSRGHASGDVVEANAILAAHPEVAATSIHVAAILGDDAAIARFLAADPASATAKGGPHNWDPLTHLCFSNYLKLSPERSDAFVRAARLLLDAGASANAGWLEDEHDPKPTWESVLYGASGVAHHPGVTALLLARGADPNDDETPYHTPETDDNRCLELLVGTGRMTDENLSMMLVRKCDWHDFDGAKFLVEHGASPNLVRNRGWMPLHHSVERDNRLEIVELLLDHGGDPAQVNEGQTVIARAARRGRGDVLAAITKRGFALDLHGVDELLGACAMHDRERVRAIAANSPAVVGELLAHGGDHTARFAGTWNTEGVALLVELGVPVDATYGGESYFGTPGGSTALHVAAWRGVAETVQRLIELGADVNRRDGRGETPLQLAIKAATESYWTYRRTPEAVRALLAAGASVAGMKYPCGYEEVDAMLQAAGAGSA